MTLDPRLPAPFISNPKAPLLDVPVGEPLPAALFGINTPAQPNAADTFGVITPPPPENRPVDAATAALASPLGAKADELWKKFRANGGPGIDFPAMTAWLTDVVNGAVAKAVAENDAKWSNLGVIEIALRNVNVACAQSEWEARALAAEARLERMGQPAPVATKVKTSRKARPLARRTEIVDTTPFVVQPVPPAPKVGDTL